MDSVAFSYPAEENKNLFATPEFQDVNNAVNFTETKTVGSGTAPKSMFSPMAAPFQSQREQDLINLMSPKEPQAGDTAPAVSEIEEAILNFRLSAADPVFGNMDHESNYFNLDNNRPDLESSTNHSWADAGTSSASRSGEMTDTFDFLIKTLSSANNYVSMLTREQLHVLRSIRPGLLYELLQEVAKIRCDRRTRRALPTECAFCKNNGENEECYSSHALKDWRGRVLCPVLRAFHCPRCGATGDRAHTIKYCPETPDSGSDRNSLSSRRRIPQSVSLFLGASGAHGGNLGGGQGMNLGGTNQGLIGGGSHGVMNSVHSAPVTPAVSATPAPSPSGNGPFSMWSSFGMN